MNALAEGSYEVEASGSRQASRKPIAALLQCSNLGGMEKVAYALFEQLKSRGLMFNIVTPRPWGNGKYRALGVDPHAQAFDYRGNFGWRSFPTFRRHAQTVCRRSEKVWVTGTDVSCLAAAGLTGKKIILSHHYHHFENGSSWLRWTAFYAAFGLRLDAITFPTEFTRNEALKIAPWLRRKTHVVRNGFDLHYPSEEQRLALKRASRKELGIPQDAFVVGNGGWLIPRKRFDVFLQTASRLSSKVANARFFICGGGPEEDNLRKLAQDLGIAERVHFAGWVQDMAPYYRSWDVQLFNSDFDALGCTPLEAASHGCLCVASVLYGGLSEFIMNGRNGFLLNKHDPEDLAEAISRLAQHQPLRLEFRQRAIEKLRADFSNEAAIEFYENYFSAPIR